MDGHLRLSTRERKTCLKTLRTARTARRALVLLLLAEGRSYREIRAATFASPTLIRSVKREFATGRLGMALRTEEQPDTVPSWLIFVVRWLLKSTPQDFGFFRSRWSCGLLALLLWEQERIRVSPETVRRGMHRREFVWRRPRPVVGPRDPEHARKLQQIQRFIGQLPANETVVFQERSGCPFEPQDRVDVDASRPASRGRHARQQRKTAFGWIASLADRTAVVVGSRKATQRGALRGPPRRPASATAVLSGDPCGLRQRQIPRLPRHPRLPASTPRSNCPPLSSEVRARDESHRARLVAPPRDDHPQSPLSVDRRTPARSHRLGRGSKNIFPANGQLHRPVLLSRLALRFGGGFI